jgi:hypothetical protein
MPGSLELCYRSLCATMRMRQSGAVLDQVLAGLVGTVRISFQIQDVFMQSHTIKQDAIEAIQRLPDHASLDDVMYTLYVQQKLARSRQAVQEGKVTSQEDARRRFLGDCR